MKKMSLFVSVLVLVLVGCASEVTPDDGATADRVFVIDDAPAADRPTTADGSPPDARPTADAQAEAQADVQPDASAEDAAPEAATEDATDAADVTPVAATLTVALAASPSSTTVVRNATNVPSVGLTFTAGPTSDALIQSVWLSGVGDTAGTFRHEAFCDVVTSCAIYQGATQVGLAQSPDCLVGAMHITNMNVVVLAGTSVTLIARCTVDSVVAQPGGDRYAIGIVFGADVSAIDTSGTPIDATLASAVSANAQSATSVIVTVLNSGTLTIERGSMRQSTNLVAGGSAPQNLGEFRATARYEDITISRANLLSSGDAANAAQIVIAQDGVVHGWTTLPPGWDMHADVDLATAAMTQIVVPRDSSITFQVWAVTNPVQSSASVHGARNGVCRTGNIMRLGLNAGLTTGEWDENYAGRFNVRATGAVSGSRIYADGTPTLGNPFALRRSVPVITSLPLPTTVLTGGTRMTFAHFSVSVNGPSIGVKSFVFAVTMSLSGEWPTNFRLHRVPEIALADVRIVDGAGNDLESGTSLATWTGVAYVIVSFTDEQIISGSGIEYTLDAMVNGTIAFGDFVSTSFMRSSAVMPETGWLTTDTTLDAAGLIGPHVTHGGGIYSGGIVWSDLSEVPHVAQSIDLGGSEDWATDVWIDDLTHAQTLIL